ncbi:MAG: SPOR domain-containing protein [Pseudomonadota bacterium]
MTRRPEITWRSAHKRLLVMLFVFELASCGNIIAPGFDAERTAAPEQSDQEVEAPDIYDLTSLGTWDGRPSLGGVWVAHPDVRSPERVIIRATRSNTSVVGSLFRKDEGAETQDFQLSLDAAEALGIAQEELVELRVTALRRIETGIPNAAQPEIPAEADTLEPAGAAGNTAATQVITASLSATLPKPFVQVGIFHVEENAIRSARKLRAAGAAAELKTGLLNQRPFWRVIAGPARNQQELAGLLATARDQGFADAYTVSN